MINDIKNEIEQPEGEKAIPALTINQGNATYIVGIHFSKKQSQTLEERIKQLIRNEALSMPCAP